jgi:menin
VFEAGKIDESVYSKNWLYQNGKAVMCDRWMEVAALVLSLNPSIDINAESEELSLIQLELLDYLYKKQHLNKYPAAICTYSGLLEKHPQYRVDVDLTGLHDEALHINFTRYEDHHVYPYCSKGFYCIRLKRYSDALRCFTGAATALSKYNHMKGDEAIHKEILEIANDLIPRLFKECPILSSSKYCFHDLVRFYDGICSWEEGSQTPVIGTVMSRHFIAIVNSFHPEIRESFKECEEFQPTPPHSPNTACGGESDKLKLCLKSAKMTDLKRALTKKEKLNVASTSLLLTALSQTHVKKRVKKEGEYDVTYSNNRRKRKRRLLD